MCHINFGAAIRDSVTEETVYLKGFGGSYEPRSLLLDMGISLGWWNSIILSED